MNFPGISSPFHVSRAALRRSRSWLACAALLAASCAAQASVIHFDDLQCDYDPARPDTDYAVPAGYGGGLVWENFSCTNATFTDSGSPLYNGSGYIDGVHTPRNLASVPFTPPFLPPDGLSAALHLSWGARFALNSLYITPVWHDNLVVTIRGLRNGAVAHTRTVTLRAGSPTFLNLQFTDVDRVEFQSHANSGTPHLPYFRVPPAMSFVGRIFALDTLDVSLPPAPPPAPVPATSAGVLAALSADLALAGAVAARRRRRKS